MTFRACARTPPRTQPEKNLNPHVEPQEFSSHLTEGLHLKNMSDLCVVSQMHQDPVHLGCKIITSLHLSRASSSIITALHPKIFTLVLIHI